MKRLNRPQFDAALAVEQCATGISIQERAQVLRDALPTIQAAELEYLRLAPQGQLFRITPSEVVTPQLDAALMTKIWKSHFARKQSPSRALYEQIKMAPEFSICPLCAQRIVKTVDHHLPKSHFPKLGLTPCNLVPACSDCNKNKLDAVAAGAEEQTLNPYFDELGNERWLFVEVQPSAPPTLTFVIRPEVSWDAVLAARVQHHFRVMGIGELYDAQAASEMADIAYTLEGLSVSSGQDGVRQHLDVQSQSRRASDPNSWKTAFYEGLRDSDWFCAEGCLMIRARRT